MNDEMRSILERSLAEGGMADGGGPDEGRIARRVRGVRRRRTAVGVSGGVAVAAVAAVVVWQAGGFTNEPMPPLTPTETTATDTPTDESTEPTTDETTEETTVPSTDPADWSDAVFPECGDTGFALPERTSQLVVESGPEAAVVPGGTWNTTIRNTGDTAISGQVSIMQQVVVDSSGTVVAAPVLSDIAFWGAEGAEIIDIAPGDELPFMIWGAYDCDSMSLPSGEYETYVVASVGNGTSTDPDDLEQIQGGPFPLVIDDESTEPSEGAFLAPEGAQQWPFECGAPFTDPEIATGFEVRLSEALPAQATAGEQLEGTAQVSVTSPLAGSLVAEVVVVQDGQVVGSGFAGDSNASYYVSAGSELELPYSSSFVDCDSAPLPAGEYEVSVVVTLPQFVEGDFQVYALAATEPVAVTLR